MRSKRKNIVLLKMPLHSKSKKLLRFDRLWLLCGKAVISGIKTRNSTTEILMLREHIFIENFICMQFKYNAFCWFVVNCGVLLLLIFIFSKQIYSGMYKLLSDGARLSTQSCASLLFRIHFSHSWKNLTIFFFLFYRRCECSSSINIWNLSLPLCFFFF